MEPQLIVSIISLAIVALITGSQLYNARQKRRDDLIQIRFKIMDAFIAKLAEMVAKKEHEDEPQLWEINIQNWAIELRTVFPDEIYYFVMNIAKDNSLEWAISLFNETQGKNQTTKNKLPNVEDSALIIITALRSKFERYIIFEKQGFFTRLWKEINCDCNKHSANH